MDNGCARRTAEEFPLRHSQRILTIALDPRLRGGMPPRNGGARAHTSLGRRKSRNVIDAIRSPARERREVYVGTFSLSSRSGLQRESVFSTFQNFWRPTLADSTWDCRCPART